MELFRSTRSEVDAILSSVPSSLLEARRLITREMQFEPRPEELQAIVKIAGFTSTSVFCYEFPRQMLSLRVMAERELGDHWNERRLSPDKLARATAVIEELLAASEQARTDLRTNPEVMTLLNDEERKFLGYVMDVMALPKDRLQAAAVLVPRLEFIAKLTTSGNVSETFPGLDNHEIEMFNQAVHLGADKEGPARVYLEAVALRTIFNEYLAVWERSGYLEDAELIEQLQDSVREQLAEAQTAYRIVSERLEKQLSDAMAANLEEFAVDIHSAKGKLFDTYVKAQPLMREPRAVEFDADVETRTLSETLADAEVADEDAASQKQRKEELYLNALTSLRSDRAAGRDLRMHPLEIRKRRIRRKRWILAMAVAGLTFFAAAVQLALPGAAPDPVAVSLKEFQPSLSVIDAKPIGPMLYVRVTDWDNLTVESIRFRTAEIGELAARKGLSSVYVVTTTGESPAEWHANGGVLVKSHAAREDVISQAEARARAALEAAQDEN